MDFNMRMKNWERVDIEKKDTIYQKRVVKTRVVTFWLFNSSNVYQRFFFFVFGGITNELKLINR